MPGRLRAQRHAPRSSGDNLGRPTWVCGLRATVEASLATNKLLRPAGRSGAAGPSAAATACSHLPSALPLSVCWNGSRTTRASSRLPAPAADCIVYLVRSVTRRWWCGVWRCFNLPVGRSLLLAGAVLGFGFTSQTNRPHRLIMELAAAPGAVPGGRCEFPELRVPALAAGSNGSSRATAAPVSGTAAKAVAAAAAVASASAASGTPASSPSYQATACWYVPARRPHHPARQHSPTLPRLDSLPCPPTDPPNPNPPPVPMSPLCSSQPTHRLATILQGVVIVTGSLACAVDADGRRGQQLAGRLADAPIGGGAIAGPGITDRSLRIARAATGAARPRAARRAQPHMLASAAADRGRSGWRRA